MSTVWAFLSPLPLLKLVIEFSRAPLAGEVVPLATFAGIFCCAGGGGGGLSGGAERSRRHLSNFASSFIYRMDYVVGEKLRT